MNAGHATLTHWAAPLIGKPWQLGADGPDAFDCRGLVRHVWRSQRGIDVPALMPEIMHDAHAIIDAALAHGWRSAGRGLKTRPREWDIVMMSSLRGPHVGVMIDVDGHLQLLHCVGGPDEQGIDCGEVIVGGLQQAAHLGFGRFELWRRDA